MNHVLVIGGGAWGSALGNVLAENNQVDILVTIPEVLKEINTQRTNTTYFPNRFNDNIKAIDNYNDIACYKLIVLAVPTAAISVVTDTLLKLSLPKDTIICNAAKGFIPESSELISHYLKRHFNNPIAAILGPGFAAEVMAKEVTVCNAVSFDEDVASKVQRFFATDYFRVYTSTDFVGAEICTTLKNIIAIASGILDGQGRGENTRAALITRGLKEIIDYGMYFGANVKTFSGICGIGDLVLTCSSTKSRNYELGRLIGVAGNAKMLKDYKMTVEGAHSAKVVYLRKPQAIDMPILSAVYNVLYNNADANEEINRLMERSLKPEFH